MSPSKQYQKLHPYSLTNMNAQIWTEQGGKQQTSCCLRLCLMDQAFFFFFRNDSTYRHIGKPDCLRHSCQMKLPAYLNEESKSGHKQNRNWLRKMWQISALFYLSLLLKGEGCFHSDLEAGQCCTLPFHICSEPESLKNLYIHSCTIFLSVTDVLPYSWSKGSLRKTS